jgi:hypothetical protein
VQAGGGLLVVAVRAGEPGTGLCVILGAAELAGAGGGSPAPASTSVMSRGWSDVLMALDADPGVEAVASQPM